MGFDRREGAADARSARVAISCCQRKCGRTPGTRWFRPRSGPLPVRAERPAHGGCSSDCSEASRPHARSNAGVRHVRCRRATATNNALSATACGPREICRANDGSRKSERTRCCQRLPRACCSPAVRRRTDRETFPSGRRREAAGVSPLRGSGKRPRRSVLRRTKGVAPAVRCRVKR